MKHPKFNLDRPRINKEQIAAYEDFESVNSGYNALKNPFWKTPWFYGTIGLSSIALVISLSLVAFNNSDPKKDAQKMALVLPEDTPCISKPTDLDIPFTTQNIDLNKDNHIKLPTGTSIEIPVGTFNFTENEAILKTREFHDKTEVFISGIEMDCQNDAFESAGMIELYVTDKEGNELTFNKEKAMSVSLAINNYDNEFEFWKLNKTNAKWENYPCEYAVADQTVQTNRLERQVDPKKVLELENLNQKYENEIISLKQPAKTEYLIPENNRQRFDLDFDASDFPELAKLKDIEFEITEKNKYDRNFTKKTWTSVDLKKKNADYSVIFKNQKEQFEISARPVLKGNDLEKAKLAFDQVLKDYETDKRALQDKKQKVNEELTFLKERIQLAGVEAKLKDAEELEKIEDFRNVANFTINNFGIYNCDKRIRYPGPFTRELPVMWTNNSIVETQKIYVFDKTRNLRFSYGEGRQRGVADLGFVKNTDNFVMIIDRNNKIGFAEFHYDQNLMKLQFKELEIKDLSVEKIKELLNGENLPT